MLIVAPMGIQKRTTFGSILTLSSNAAMVTGRVAELQEKVRDQNSGDCLGFHEFSEKEIVYHASGISRSKNTGMLRITSLPGAQGALTPVSLNFGGDE